MQSAVNQTYKNIEIIVSDDCSSDDTELVLPNIERAGMVLILSSDHTESMW
ncbi:MAG: glycosyltransferase family 2 protein [Nitrospira sp.]|nr:glycosyltransferase family 2 protein [Nitrospira sp.]